jgi:hypothetical protein
VAFTDECSDLLDEPSDFPGVFRLAIDEQIVTLRSNADVQEAFEVAKIVVIGPEERGEAVLTDGNAASSSGSDRDISLCYKELTEPFEPSTPDWQGQASPGLPLTC